MTKLTYIIIFLLIFGSISHNSGAQINKEHFDSLIIEKSNLSKEIHSISITLKDSEHSFKEERKDLLRQWKKRKSSLDEVNVLVNETSSQNMLLSELIGVEAKQRSVIDSIKILEVELSNLTQNNYQIVRLSDTVLSLQKQFDGTILKQKKLLAKNSDADSKLSKLQINQSELRLFQIVSIPVTSTNPDTPNEILEYLEREPYDKLKVQRFMASCPESKKNLKLRVSEYCLHTRKAYIIIQQLIQKNDVQFALKLYNIKYKSEVESWKESYPWLYKNFIENLNHMDDGVNTLPFPKCND